MLIHLYTHFVSTDYGALIVNIWLNKLNNLPRSVFYLASQRFNTYWNSFINFCRKTLWKCPVILFRKIWNKKMLDSFDVRFILYRVIFGWCTFYFSTHYCRFKPDQVILFFYKVSDSLKKIFYNIIAISQRVERNFISIYLLMLYVPDQ